MFFLNNILGRELLLFLFLGLRQLIVLVARDGYILSGDLIPEYVSFKSSFLHFRKQEIIVDFYQGPKKDMCKWKHINHFASQIQIAVLHP